MLPFLSSCLRRRLLLRRLRKCSEDEESLSVMLMDPDTTKAGTAGNDKPETPEAIVPSVGGLLVRARDESETLNVRSEPSEDIVPGRLVLDEGALKVT